MKIYHSYNIKDLVWSEHKEAQFVKKTWLPLLLNGARHYIRNVDCEVALLVEDDLYLPIVIPNSDYANSYVCSPYGQYVDYGQKEVDIELGDKPWISNISKGAIQLFAQSAPRATFDKVIFVNNWLLSTNLYPHITRQQINKITTLLIDNYPDCAIIFRSVGDQLNAPLLQQLEEQQYQKILSRQIYILNPKEGIYKKKKAFKEDLRLQRNRSEYNWQAAKDCPDTIWQKAKLFYDDLYLRKYSYLNPQFTNAFFRESIVNDWFNYFFLQKEGNVHACVGYFERNGILTTPIFGYDFDLPQKEGLYRLMSLKIIQDGLQKGLIIHNSSGAANYKKLRGAVPSSEYNLVYTKHLSTKRQLPWKILKGMTKYIANPILQHYEL